MSSAASQRFCSHVQADASLLAALFRRLALEGVILRRIDLMQDIDHSHRYALTLEMDRPASFDIAEFLTETPNRDKF